MLVPPICLLLASSQSKRRHRYIGFRVLKPEGGIEREKLKRALLWYCKRYFREGYRDVGLRLTRFNGKEGMVHCYHIYKEKVIDLLNSIDKILGEDAKIVTIGTSGTIKSLNRKFFGGRLKREHDPDFKPKWRRK